MPLAEVPTRAAPRSEARRQGPVRGRTPNQSALDQFVEVTASAGIHFTLTSGGLDKRYIIEAQGRGRLDWAHNK